MDDLPLEIRPFNDVVVDDSEPPDARSREILEDWCAEAAGPDDQHIGVEQCGLPLRPNVVHDDVPGVAVKLFWVQIRSHSGRTPPGGINDWFVSGVSSCRADKSRLLSCCAGGPRQGVYRLIDVGEKVCLPIGFVGDVSRTVGDIFGCIRGLVDHARHFLSRSSLLVRGRRDLLDTVVDLADGVVDLSENLGRFLDGVDTLVDLVVALFEALDGVLGIVLNTVDHLLNGRRLLL